jgi:hypothetical protein
MSIFGNNTGGTQAATQAALLQQIAATQANGDLQTAANKATADFATNYYDPYSATGTNANTMYANALGLNGPTGNTTATNAFQVSPGYNFALQQGTQALDRSAAGGGTFGSGNAAIALDQYGQGLANQQYGNWLTNLQGLGQQGLAAATGQTGREQSLANIQTGLGQNQANVITGAATNAANGLTAGANADMSANLQGQSNLFSALLGGANLGAKLYSPTPNTPASSDKRDKTDIAPLGKDETGKMVYAYRYKGDSKAYPKVIGYMAQDIEKQDPSAVNEIGGHKVVDARAMYHAALNVKKNGGPRDMYHAALGVKRKAA